MSLRDEFPVLQRVAFLNAGSDGPVPRAAVEAAREEVEHQALEGRDGRYFGRRAELRRQQAERYAARLGCAPDEVSVTTSTTEGIATVAAGFGRGDKIVTSDEEHPGVYGPLGRARERGAEIVVAPFDRLPEAVDVATTAVVCSHVSWVSGRIAPAELASVGVPVVYDGAQGIGAVPVDVKVLGCAAYAGSGQKWLCGPDGSGMLYVEPAFRERVPTLVASYWNLEDPASALECDVWPHARAWDAAGLSGETSSFALTSLDVLEEAGWTAVHERAATLAARLAELLEENGRRVSSRGASTLVAWEHANAPAAAARALEAGVLIRDIPGRGLLRASVGAWNDETDLERLLAAV